MKKDRHFLFSAWLDSAVLACLAAITANPGRWIPENLPVQRVIWSGLFFLTIYCTGFLGMQIPLRLARKFQVRHPRRWMPVFLLMALLIFLLGATGQALFMRGVTETITYASQTDIILLLDDSYSMYEMDYEGPCKQAAGQFMDSLDENCQMQVISFDAMLGDVSPLTVMDDDGKAALRAFIDGIALAGGTDFNPPLEAALDTIRTEGSDDRNKAVILLTDGESRFSSSLVGEYQDEEICLFVIRIGPSSVSSDTRVDALIQFAQETGGFYLTLTPDTDNAVDASAITTAFEDAFATVTEEVTSIPEGRLIDTANVSAYQQVVRYLTLALCSLLFGIGYFGRLRIPQGLLNILVGVLLAALIPLLSETAGFAACAGLSGVLLGSSVVILRVNEEM